MIKRVALRWLLTAAILAASLHAVYLATHTHLRTYAGGASVSVAGWSATTYRRSDTGYAHGNIGVALGAPTGTCVGAEYWRDGSNGADIYIWPHDC